MWWSDRQIEQGLCDAEDAWLKEQRDPCEMFQGFHGMHHGRVCLRCGHSWLKHPGGRLFDRLSGKELRDAYLREAEDQRESDESNYNR